MTNTPANKYQRRTTLITGGAFHFFHDGIADGLAVFLPMWQTSFSLSLTHVGLLVTCFEGATGFFQIPAGFLGERFGERALLIGGTLVTAISFICLGFIEGLISLVFFCSSAAWEPLYSIRWPHPWCPRLITTMDAAWHWERTTFRVILVNLCSLL
jgi:MFS family permease